MNKQPHPAPVAYIAGAKIFVRGIVVHTEIGVYEHEHGRTQPLVVDVELELGGGHPGALADEDLDRCLAHPGSRTGDDSHLVIQQPHHVPPRSPASSLLVLMR